MIRGIIIQGEKDYRIKLFHTRLQVGFILSPQGSGFVFRSNDCLRKFEEGHTKTLSWHLLVYYTYNMQLLSLLFVAALAVASPGPSLYARAAATDACNVGYCTQNGGYVLLPHLPPTRTLQ